MLVRICHDIFSNSDNDLELDNFLPFFNLGKHQLVLNDVDDFLAFNNSTWKKQLKGANLKLIQKGIKASNKKKSIVISNSNPNENFSLQEAFLFLNQSLVILVENKQYEPPFINAIIKNFDNGEIENAHKNKWWKYEMFAGSSVEQVIEGEIKDEFENKVFIKEKCNYLRYLVILDSDKTHLNMVNNTVLKKIEFLERNGVNYHVLLKREKENYMPEKNLRNKNDIYFNCYLKNNKDTADRHRDFFDIEKGFNNKNKSDKVWKDKRKEEADFFEINNIGDEDWKILRKGVNDQQTFKSTFSTDFNLVTKDDFEQVIRYQPFVKSKIDSIERNEFEHIVNEIKYLL